MKFDFKSFIAIVKNILGQNSIFTYLQTLRNVNEENT